MATKSTGKKIAGIFIPVQLDTSKYIDDIKALRNQTVSVISTIQSSFNKSLDTTKMSTNLVNLQKSFGAIRDGAKALDNIKLGGLDTALAQLNPQLTKVAQTLGVSAEAQTKFLKAAASTQAINQQVTALNQLKNITGLTAKEFDKLIASSNMSVSAEAMSKFSQQQQQRQQRNLLTAAFTPSNITAGLQSGAAAFGVVGGAYGVAEFTKSTYEATRQMDNLNLSFQSIFGSSDEASVHIDYVRQMVDKLGLSFLETSAGAKKLFAAAQGTVLQEEATQIFEAFSTMSAALKLSGSETESVFLAVSQMISKGKVSAEELRLQLSERMPGAVNLFAKAIGVTTKELDSMLQKGEVGLEHLVQFSKEVQNTYSAGAINASQGMQAEMARISTLWFEFKASLVDTEGSTGLFRGVQTLIEGLIKLAPVLSATVELALKLGVALASAFVVGKVLAGAKALLISLNSLQTALKGSAFEMGALRAKSATTVTSMKALTLSMGGFVTIAGTLALGIYELVTAQSEANKLFEDLQVSSSGFAQELKNVENVAEEVTNSLDNLRVSNLKENLEQSLKDIDTALSVSVFFNPLSETEVDKQFKEAFDVGLFTSGANRILAGEASTIGESFLSSLNEAMKSGASSQEVDTIFSNYVEGMSDFLNMLSDKELVTPEQFKAIQEVANKTLTLGEQAREAGRAYEELNAKIEALSSSTGATDEQKEELVSFINEFEKVSNSLLETTAKLDTAKAQQQNTVNQTLIKELAYLTQNKLKYEELGETATEEIQDINKVLSRIPEYLRQNNINIEEFTQKMYAAGATSTEVNKIVNAWRELAEIDLSQSLEGFTKDLQTQLNTLGATSLESKLFKFGEAQGLDLSITKNVEALKALDRAAIESATGATISEEAWSNLVVTYNALAEATKKVITVPAGDTGGGTIAQASQASEAIKEIQSTIANIQEANLYLSESEQFYKDIMDNIADYQQEMTQKGFGSPQEIAQLEAYIAKLQETALARKQAMDLEGIEEGLKAFRELAILSSGTPDQVKQSQLDISFTEQIKELDKYWSKVQEYKAFDLMNEQEYLELKNVLQEQHYMSSLEYSESYFEQLIGQSQEYIDEYSNLAKDMASWTLEAARSMADALKDFALDGEQSFGDLLDSFKNLTAEMVAEWAATTVKLGISQLASGLGSLVMGAFTGGSTATSSVGGGTPTGSAMQLIRGYAKGGALVGGNISSYSGSVVSSPTMFSYGVQKFATGAGLMGEAGAEAIMPLQRNASGKLGVSAEGIGGSNVNISIVNETNVPNTAIQTSQEQKANGDIEIKNVIISTVSNNIMQGGQISQAITNANAQKRISR